MFVVYIVELCDRFKYMILQKRMPHANRLQSVLYFIIDMVLKFEWVYENKFIFDGIACILMENLYS